jgi:putative lipoic acid-binding regulatory protein
MSGNAKGDGSQPPADQTPPKIEFPCEDYPIKIVGDAEPRYEEVVLEVVENHAPALTVQL